jgi:hypothetical protein
MIGLCAETMVFVVFGMVSVIAFARLFSLIAGFS